MFEIVKDLIGAGLESKDDLIRRTTLVTCMPTILVCCVVAAGAKAINEYLEELIKEVPGLYRDSKDIWVNTPVN